MNLRDFKLLSFDCYGTLIDWESGIFAAFQPLLSRARPGLDRDAVLEAFARRESALEQATPTLHYDVLLAQVHDRLAQDWGVAADAAESRRFGESVPDWPEFPDSGESLRYLKQHYRLVILSNVHRAGFAASNRRLGVEFDAIFTAEDIGSYKPDSGNFAHMLARLGERGIDRSEILHIAQSLFHDHAPAQAAGLSTAWIDRRHDRSGFGATMPPPRAVTPAFRFEGMADLVRAHRESA